MKTQRWWMRFSWSGTAMLAWLITFRVGPAVIVNTQWFYLLLGAIAYGIIARLLFWVAMKLIKSPDRRLRCQANYDKAAIAYAVLMALTIAYGETQN